MRKKRAKRPNGAGSVYWSRANQCWLGAVRREGKRTYVYGPRGDSSPEAKLGVQERLRGHTRTNASAGRELLHAFAQRVVENADIRPKTRTTYRWALDGYIEGYPIATMPLRAITPVHVRDHLASLRPLNPEIRKEAGPDTVRRVRLLLHRVFAEAMRLEIIDKNPVDRVAGPRVRRKRMNVWTPEEALFFLRHARGDRLYVLYLLALTTTMGPAELFAVQRSDVHLNGGYLWVSQNLEDNDGVPQLAETKTDARRRRIDLPALAVDALREHLKANLQHGAFVFTSPGGQPLRRNNVNRREWKPLLERIAKKAEEEARKAGNPQYRFPRLRLYDLRHTANALMGFLGVPLDVAKARMGHSSIRTTVDVYGHLYSQQSELVARKLDGWLEPLKKA